MRGRGDEHTRRLIVLGGLGLPLTQMPLEQLTHEQLLILARHYERLIQLLLIELEKTHDNP